MPPIDTPDAIVAARRRTGRSLRTALAVTAVSAVTATIAGCGSDGGGGADTSAPDGGVVQVMATTTVWADVAANVGCDGLVEVETVMPAGADPHAYEPSLRDRERLGDADVVVANGLALEESLLDTLASVEAEGVTVVRAGDHVAVLDVDDHGDDEHADDEHADDEHTDDEHGHDEGDPHIWFDPTRVAAALPAIGDALVDAGAERTAVDACVAAYTAELTALDDEITAIVDALPAERRLLVTNHDSLGYFADRYGFDVIGTVIPSPSSLAATTPADLEALAHAIEDSGVPAIFAETQHSSEDMEALAARVGDVEVVTLRTDTLGDASDPTGTYTGWLRVTAEQIVGALTAAAS